MKKIIISLTTVFVSLFAASCLVLEETRFNEDGSVYYSISIDGSPMIDFFSETFDSLNNNNKQTIDTIISLADTYENMSDSISQLPLEEQQQLESLKQFNLKMNYDTDEGLLKAQFYGDFVNFNAFQNAMANVDKVEAIPTNDNKVSIGRLGYLMSKDNAIPFGNNKIEWDGKILKNTIISSSKIYDEESTDKELTDDPLALMKYTIVYTFPKEVKSVNNTAYSISENGKTVTQTFDLPEYVKNPEISSVIIELED